MVLLGLAIGDGVKNREMAISLVLDNIVAEYGVRAEELKDVTKVAVFWSIGRKITKKLSTISCESVRDHHLSRFPSDFAIKTYLRELI